ncbi:MAG: Asp-tRNA(Asn)/Glu-tRNA(Gln) amidotransferase subunit GatA [Sulfolobales archaeon]|nr:Asp-tRNA(Asn)/Glu-tRNA(Gln) amidotransferase subunit GatA [Sulfolobales archaeon]MDW8083566.1 Asp-tRNA(Asn)/Glu-tRNA(Gln) amidotransferase subunit GatA [Sulfolobales archaeon]
MREDSDFLFKYVEEVYRAIERYEQRLRAYITLRPISEVIDDIENLVKHGKLGPLGGALVAVKDNISTKGIRTTCGSKMLENYVPPYDATAVSRIKNSGGVVIGKTNMDEFAMGSTTENSAFYPTLNPWDYGRVPGGSSGGSAVAVAACEATVSLGSDTGGSIRLPAAYTGIVGLKPTYGLVSRYGLVAYGSSLDQIGPMGRCVEDVAIVLNVISGHDPRDSTSLRVNVENFEKYVVDYPLKRYRVVVLEEMVSEGIDEKVMKIFNSTLDVLAKRDVTVEFRKMPLLHYSLPTYYIIAMAEASSNLARFDGLRYGTRSEAEGKLWVDAYRKTRMTGFGEEVKRRILLGTYVLSEGLYEGYYLKAAKVRRLLHQEFTKLFREYDAALSPTSPTLPPRLGEAIVDPIKLYSLDINTVPINLAGLPAISVPGGFAEGLPVGIQIFGPPLSEGFLLNIAKLIESGRSG